MKHTGAEIIIKLLERYGIKTIAGIPGGSNLPLYNALFKSSIHHILARHEQGAGFIAHGMARSTGKPAVCLATSGPGVTNLLTAIADAYLDSIPVIAITGQVALPLIGTDAFQEVDTYGLTLPITKHNFLARSAAELLNIIPEAFRIALSGRPGPVLIDVPKNIQNETCEFSEWPDYTIDNLIHTNPDEIEKFAAHIHKSKRPVIYTGGGCITSGASHAIRKLAHKNSIPVCSSLMGLGTFPSSDRNYIGMLGMHGATSTNYIIKEADLFIASGARFDDRATGRVKDFCPDATIIHVDIDPAEIDKIKKSCFAINGDVKSVIEALIPNIKNDTRKDWIDYVTKVRETHPFINNPDLFHPVNIIKEIGNIAEPDTIITTDVGQHQMWTAQAYPFIHPRTFLTSGGLGTMGFGLPTAIGAALANPGKPVICISGDGSFLMNIQELATLADLNLTVKIIILNNRHLGLVRQQQEMFYEGNIFASEFISNPDFAAIANEFSVRGINFGINDPVEKLRQELQKPGPCLINIPINHEYNVLPMVPPGAANHEMIGGSANEKHYN